MGRGLLKKVNFYFLFSRKNQFSGKNATKKPNKDESKF